MRMILLAATLFAFAFPAFAASRDCSPPFYDCDNAGLNVTQPDPFIPPAPEPDPEPDPEGEEGEEGEE